MLALKKTKARNAQGKQIGGQWIEDDFGGDSDTIESLRRGCFFSKPLGPPMNYFASAIFMSFMLFSFSMTGASEKPVTLKGAIEADSEQADQYTVTIEMNVRDGWHTYDEEGEHGETATSLELKLPEGVTEKGDWNRPEGNAGADSQTSIFEGQVSFSKTVVIDPSAYGKNIEVTVSFQACTDKACNPPQSKTVSIAIPKTESPGSTIFERPVRINVDGKPLNTVEQKKFLSPAIFDVDGDDKAELVISDLWGDLGVHENLNTSGSGDPVWGARKALKDTKGKAIRTSNW